MGKYKKRILLAVDGSDQAFAAVDYVSRMFPPHRLEAVLFHVMSKISEGFWDIERNPAFRHRLATVSAWSVEQDRAIKGFLEGTRRLLLDRGVPEGAVTISIQERKKGIATEIVRESQANYDAVVIGRWGMSKVQDFVLGGMANKLIGRLAHVPLYVVGGTPPQVGKILLAMDTSEGAMRALDHAAAMVEDGDSRITLFHVVRGFPFLPPGRESAPPPGEQDVWTAEQAKQEFRKAEAVIKPVFEEAIARLEQAGFNRDQITTKIVTGVISRAKTIVEEARSDAYGTIVVGRRGLSRVEEFFMGRVSNKVVQLAKDMAVWVVS